MPRTVEAQTLANVITNMQYNYYTHEADRLAANIYNIGLPESTFPRPPSLNDRLCAKIMDATGSRITLALLERAYMECIVPDIRTEPDGLWAGPHLYVEIRDVITSQPGYARQYNPNTDTLYDIVFRSATLHRDPSMPATEILIFNSRRPELSIRIIHLSPQST